MRLMLPMLFILALTSMSASASSQVTATNVRAEIRTPSTVVLDNSLTGVPLGTPDDSITTSAATTIEGPDVSVESTAVTVLSASAIGLSSQWIGQSAPNTGVIRLMIGGGQIDFHDEVPVTSPILPDGTPVVVTFAFFASHTSLLLHSDGTTDFNNSQVRYRFSGQISNLPSFQNTLVISSVDHDYREDFGLLGTQTAVGMMNPAVSLVTFDFPTMVGQTIDVAFRLTAEVAGGVFSTENLTQTQVGSAIGAVGLAFGASPAIADVDLASNIFSGSFPSQAMANLANAQSAMPATPPSVPVLSRVFQVLLVVGVVLTSVWSWRRRPISA